MIGRLPLGEVLPAAPAIPAGVLALLGLVVFLGYLVATGTLKVYAHSLGYLIRWLAGKIDVPIPTGFHTFHPFAFIASGLLTVDSTIRDALASLALAAEHGASWLFTQAGNIMAWTGREIGDLAETTVKALHLQRTVEIPAAVRKATAQTLQRLHGIDRTLGRLEAQFHEQARRLRAGIDRLDRLVTHTLPHEISGVRSRVGTVAHGIDRLEGRLERLEHRFATRAFTAAVAVAMVAILGRWIRCPALRRVGRKVGCGGFHLLDDLLALTFDAMLVADLCTIVDVMTKAARAFAGEIDFLAGQISGLIKCQGASRPKALPVAWYEPPPVLKSLEL